ncbi:MAG: AbgT family transporter [Bacteroidetes bacterium]|nr:AbgT family transporter [Bacteroidota bacterium]MCL2301705.1 AbgT family transporter [Lentimicrobiaceae bacterium]
MKIPHTFTIVFSLVILCAVATWFVPGGEFARETVEIDGATRSIVIGDSFQYTESNPQTWQIFTAFFNGFKRTAHIIAFIFMLGGAFWILNATNAINIGISGFLKSTEKLQKNRFLNKIGVNNIVIALIMIVFSLFGAIFGMSEETIAFIIIFVPLAISMGYDSVTGVLMCYVAAHVGFGGAMLNPFTVGIAQGLAGLPIFSGIEYRTLCWIILTAITIAFTLWYANRVKKNPKRSFMYEIDSYWRQKAAETEKVHEVQKSSWATWAVYGVISSVLVYCSFTFTYSTITIGNSTISAMLFPVIAALFIPFGFYSAYKSVHSYILSLLLLTVVILIVGVLGYHWYVGEIAGLFFAMGVASGLAYHHTFDKIIRLFLDGCKDIMNAALVVAIGGGIIIILEDGQIIDTILYGISQTMANAGEVGSVGAMYFIQTVLNLLIPSSSAKAVLTIPMMAEFSDIIGVSRQLTVLAYQLGDGFTNMITPTSGVLIGCLGIARVPYSKWLKFFFPFLCILVVIGFLLLLPPLFFQFNGF